MNYKVEDSRRKPQNQKKSIWSKLLVLLLVVFLVGSGALFYAYSQYRNALSEPNSDLTEQVEFRIEAGESAEQVADRLISEELLRKENRTYFLFYLKRSGEGAKFQAGDFRIPKNLNIKELSLTLQNAGIPDVWVTIPEGLRKEEIALILSDAFSQYENSVFSADQFLALTEDPTFISQFTLPVDGVSNLEGFLFPDKYLLPIESTNEYVITAMLNNFAQKVPVGVSYDDLVIASMLEREGRNSTERAMISDIIRRRLEEGWFLGIDATLLYYHQDWKYVLTYEDIETDHPYNTYTNLGLPPTPISNPGLSSINASLNPTPNSYYYYLHDSSGQIHYAVTLQEHNLNIAEHL